MGWSFFALQAKKVTQYESDHGAATHVAFRKGQILTIVKPDFEAKNWLAFIGRIVGTHWLPTCRAQVEVELDADTADVLQNLRGFYCMLAYRDYVREVAYAARKAGIEKRFEVASNYVTTLYYQRTCLDTRAESDTMRPDGLYMVTS